MQAPRDYVTVVTGLPRSGTSLLMQMLAAGGMPLLVDGARPADAHNPRGYFELSAVRSLRRDASFVADAAGRAVKVVLPLCRDLPPGPAYRLLLVRRHLEEIVASQDAMLGPDAPSPGPGRSVAELLAAELAAFDAWVRQRPGLRLLEVEHARLLAEPRPVAAEVAGFLGGLDVAPMAAVVEPALHRQRAAPGTRRSGPQAWPRGRARSAPEASEGREPERDR